MIWENLCMEGKYDLDALARPFSNLIYIWKFHCFRMNFDTIIYIWNKKIFNEIYLIYYGNTIHISRWQMLSAFKLYIWFIFEFYRLKETDLWEFSYIYIWIFFIIINNNLFCNLLWLFYKNKSLKLIKCSFKINVLL